VLLLQWHKYVVDTSCGRIQMAAKHCEMVPLLVDGQAHCSLQVHPSPLVSRVVNEGYCCVFDNTAWIEKVIPSLGVQKSQLGIVVIRFIRACDSLRSCSIPPIRARCGGSYA
jgi:hypothetical protein